MASRSAHPEARPYIREASKALRHHNLPGGFRESLEKEDGIEILEVRNSAPISINDYGATGRWTLHLAWTIRRDPATGDSVLWKSSIGLNVRGVKFALDEPVCLVRYDLDRERPGPNLASIGAHLNVFQPDPLRDRVHFPVLAGSDRVWGVREVIDVFLAPEFVADLARCVGSA